MRSRRKFAYISVLSFGLFLVPVYGQVPVTPPAPAPSLSSVTDGTVTVDENLIRQQFGEEFKLVDVSTPYVRDIDGDGIDDLVIVARSKKPMLDAAEHNYRVVDPYYSFYGYGDPKLTATFGSEDVMDKNLVVLIIHGSGPDAWRAATPRAKYVIINVPLKKIAVKRLQLRKKQVNAIYAVEADASAGDSVLFWDGKQYKYQPIGTNSAN